eukprot:TCONS_00011730-protein
MELKQLLLILTTLCLLMSLADCHLQLCRGEVEHTFPKTESTHRKIIFRKSSDFISNVFSYATINITSNSKFAINRSNKSSGYLSLLMSNHDASNNYVKDKLSCFEDFNITLTLDEPSSIKFIVLPKRFDQISFLIFLFGCFLFVNAKSLSRSMTFLYASCASVGVLASCLILLFICYRLVPYKRMMAFLMTVGSGMWLYFLEHFQYILGSFIMEHPYHVTAYLFTSALLSIALLYYYGVPSNERALNLLQWSMQLIAVYLIYFSSYSKAFSITVVVILTIFQVISFVAIVSGLVKFCVPKKYTYLMQPAPKHRFLSMEEYERQCKETTERELKELKEYCESPKCNSWKVVSRLKDPKRFASFLESGDQFTNEEKDDYYIDQDNEDEEEEETLQRDSSFKKRHMTTVSTSDDSIELEHYMNGHTLNQREWISDDERNESFLS